MRTQEEIQNMIARLSAERDSLPEFSIFGNANHQAIDAAIRVLKDNKDEEDINILYFDIDEDNYTYDMAMGARQWLDGDISDEDLVG